ncbi:MAG: sigma-70 family RNA polymerase sigma factor, partial [Bacilli bacterium]
MEYKDLNDFELVSYVADNEEVTDFLFEKYRPLISSLAKKLYNANQNIGLDYNDLVQEGMVGFSTAINTYSEHKDTLFFTYAKKCIESKMISMIVSASRLKHQILNNSLSMEAIDSEEFNNSLDKIIGDKTSNPEDIAIDNENLLELINSLNQEFTDFESQVFDMKKSGFNYREIAEVLDVDPKKVDNALQRIKAKVRT